MDSKDKVPVSSIDLTNPKNETARRAQELAEIVRYWGLAYARQKLGNEVVNQAWADGAFNPRTEDEYYPTESQALIDSFPEEELEPWLIDAYAEASGDNPSQVDIIINLLEGSLFIGLDDDNKAKNYGLMIKLGSLIEFRSASLLAEQRRADKIKKILNDMETAFKVVLG